MKKNNIFFFKTYVSNLTNFFFASKISQFGFSFEKNGRAQTAQVHHEVPKVPLENLTAQVT